MGKRAFAFLLGFAALALAEEQRIVRHRIVAMVGQYVDLDSGTVLSRAKVGRHVADFRLLRRGKNFALVQLGGDGEPLLFQWHPALSEKDRHVVRTSEGRYARLRGIPSNSYSFGVLSLECDLNLAGTRDFPDGAKYVLGVWKDGALTVSWSGPDGRYVVRSGAIRAVVDGKTVALKGLAEGELHRVEVRRLVDGLLTAPAIAAFAAGPKRVLRKSIAMPGAWHRVGGGVDLRRLEPHDASPDVTFYLYGVYAPGGVQKIGSGEKDFRTRNLLPIGGYKPFHHRLDHDDVYAIKLRDGRYAKVWIRHDGNGRIVNGMVAECVLLAGGGHRLPTMVGAVTWQPKGDRIRLRWNPVEADHYIVRLANGMVLWKGSGHECDVALARNAFHDLEVAAFYADQGGESAPARLEVHTYPLRYRVGTFTLDARGRDAYSFTRDVVDSRFPELRIASSGQNARVLTLHATYGIAPSRRFGDAQGAMVDSGGAAHMVDANRPHTETFRVRSKDGGIASVRVVRRHHPSVTFKYVYAPPVAGVAAFKADGRVVTWKPVEGALHYELRVDSGEPVIVRETAFRFPEARRNAFIEFALTIVMKDGERIGPISRTTNTFSKNYRVGTVNVQPYGRQWVSFKGGGIAVEGKGEFRMRTVDSQRILLHMPQGGELQGKGRYGTFPDADARPALAKELTVAKAELIGKGLLVRTLDGGWASVRLAETVRWRKWTLEFVYRKPVSREEMVRPSRRSAESPRKRSDWSRSSPTPTPARGAGRSTSW
jgi:hypothetical protein